MRGNLLSSLVLWNNLTRHKVACRHILILTICTKNLESPRFGKRGDIYLSWGFGSGRAWQKTFLSAPRHQMEGSACQIHPQCTLRIKILKPDSSGMRMSLNFRITLFYFFPSRPLWSRRILLVDFMSTFAQLLLGSKQQGIADECTIYRAAVSDCQFEYFGTFLHFFFPLLNLENFLRKSRLKINGI